MDALQKLKATLLAKKQEKQEVAGDKKQFKKVDLEEARLKRLREEEERERQEKDLKKRKAEVVTLSTAGSLQSAGSQDLQAALLPKEEVIRRLRALKQPATLFGEEDLDRYRRLLKAEKEVNVDDETLGGGVNTLVQLQRQAAKAKKSNKASGGDAQEKAAKQAKDKAAAAATQAEGPAGEEEDPVAAAFARAAAVLAERQAEQSMTVEDRIGKYIKAWCKEWGQDLEARSESVKESGSGRQATLTYSQCMTYFEGLYSRLKRRSLDPELRTGLWMIVQSMRDRNYLAAYDVYLRLAIGNAPWPIGVTSVGIHERSAREKISHVMNGQAHIMNDEATRKYFQALKRLMTQVQRLHPVDPSRAVDFCTYEDEGKGNAGRGSDRAALLAAEAAGENAHTLGLPAPPSLLEADGSVRIPPKWDNILAREGAGFVPRGQARTPPRTQPKTPPLTPPREAGEH